MPPPQSSLLYSYFLTPPIPLHHTCAFVNMRDPFAWEEEKVVELRMALQNSIAAITNNPDVVAWSAHPSGEFSVKYLLLTGERLLALGIIQGSESEWWRLQWVLPSSV
ncbi:hypothetical protein Acr_12g0001750 [Actinidia rufa]|uniref:Uncharacterized protein n=1 Tax=Actinidia rufa TaxID=165716 RepID=A0A7J0FG05_9ERIC|nr:hypothetical protein Acr_12g0001750 [Actinidia rufa]